MPPIDPPQQTNVTFGPEYDELLEKLREAGDWSTVETLRRGLRALAACMYAHGKATEQIMDEATEAGGEAERVAVATAALYAAIGRELGHEQFVGKRVEVGTAGDDGRPALKVGDFEFYEDAGRPVAIRRHEGHAEGFIVKDGKLALNDVYPLGPPELN